MWELGSEHSLGALHRARALTWPLAGRSILGTTTCPGIASGPELGSCLQLLHGDTF